MLGITYLIIIMALFNLWMTIIITNRQNNNLNELEPNRKLIYQESWVLKLECLKCYERFERWNKKLAANNHSAKAIIKENDERKEKQIKGENKNEKANVNILWVKKVKSAKKKNKDEIKEKMEEWMIERMEDNEWLREWMDGVVG
ncbi:hypothetical protein RclHR1_02280003 [Rhizophagus clarus]|uniref:Uncharacterized protein n=1 Tax=Rhizophagus clarus TaxID=94130 RepID=A0A2Z6QVP3_9GLOM|nr:hypothetical protein RclHR1_02280003 [Rhizophagus clarus]GES75718.1 hypothetical protein GLOIN_2v1606545 [Rhizophagus clarus]